MTETLRCPDCGLVQSADREICERCNFPLHGVPVSEPTAAPEPTAPAPTPIPRRIRPPRPRTLQPQMLSIWLMVAVVTAIAIVIVGVRGFQQSNIAPIEGAKETQQKRGDEFRAALAKDSTNVAAQVGLGDVLYDTGNWSEAIVHYRAAIARDSSRATTLVDLGVCYYNLSDDKSAEQLFLLALKRDPHQPVALFNLGIVAERRQDYRAALQFLHRAIESDPPESMKKPLMDAMQQVQKELGVKAPPLPEGSK